MIEENEETNTYINSNTNNKKTNNTNNIINNFYKDDQSFKILEDYYNSDNNSVESRITQKEIILNNEKVSNLIN